MQKEPILYFTHPTPQYWGNHKVSVGIRDSLGFHLAEYPIPPGGVIAIIPIVGEPKILIDTYRPSSGKLLHLVQSGNYFHILRETDRVFFRFDNYLETYRREDSYFVFDGIKGDPNDHPARIL